MTVTIEAGALSDVGELGVAVHDRGPEIEANRTLPGDVVALLVAAGVPKIFVPTDLGGAQAHVLQGLAAFEDIAYHDGSTGWCAMIAGTTGVLAGFLPVEHARAIYGRDDAITGGFAAPMGRARAFEDSDGGLSVTGRWQWGSGTRHCTAIGGGCRLVDEHDQPADRALDGLRAPFVFFEPVQVELLDTWYVAGLRGTGSTDYQVTDAVVPEGRWVEVGRTVPTHDGPLYRFSFFGLLAAGITSVALGLARRALDELVEVAATKRPQGSRRPLAERSTVQADVASAEGAVASGWALLAESAGDAWDTLAAGDTLTDEHRRRLRLAATHGTQSAARAVDLAYHAAGGTAVYDTSPLQRVFRDTHVATQHAMTAPRTLELVGRMRLGLDTDTAQL